MAQSNYTIANGNGAAVRAALNTLFAAIQSNNSGSSAPSETVPGMIWVDTSLDELPRVHVRSTNAGWRDISDGNDFKIQLNRKAISAPPHVNNLEVGELCLSTTTGQLWAKINSSTVTEITSTGTNVPVGGIILWSGAVSNIPTGWALCDGTNGTPDLRGRFVVGAGGTYDVDGTGGSEAITDVPRHRHNINLATENALDHVQLTDNDVPTTAGDDVLEVMADQSQTTGTLSHHHLVQGFSEFAGEAEVSILPPYYALCYIMKT